MITWLEKNNKTSWTITTLIALFIFYASSKTGEETAIIPKLNFLPEFYHIAIFFFLSFFLLISLVQGKYKNLIIFAVIIAILYGTLDELHQFFVPGRDPELADIISNTIGALSAAAVYIISLRIRNSKS